MGQALEPFKRYRAIIDDWSAFVTACNRPLPTCIWNNRSRISSEELARRLSEQSVAFEPVSWFDGAFRLPSEADIGRRLEYLIGLCHVQEEVALLPVLLLDPQPGERILDFCAAPGNKTAQIALQMELSGSVIANDVNHHRMRAMRRIINRLGLTNVCTTLHNAATYPRQPIAFDRILVDVPCTCEGTSRKHPGVLREVGPKRSADMARLQAAILRRAMQLCKAGGRVVYSTCTYAPEENEMVVQEVLEELAPRIEAQIMPVNLSGLQWSPGLEKWQGRTFRKDMTNAIRIYPHQNDTGGFFVAVIAKNTDRPQKETGETVDARHRLARVDPAPWVDYLEDRFGIPRDSFDGLEFFRANRKSIAIKHVSLQPTISPEPHFIGLPFFRTNLRYPKPSTAAAMIFGREATRNVIEVDAEGAEDFLSGKMWLMPDGRTDAEEGYVLVQHDGYTLGVGLYFRKAEGATVRSLFPKAWRLITLKKH